MLREVKTIYLYLKLDYREEGTGEYLDDDGEFKPVPAVWIYSCLEYKFDDRKDISTNFSSPCNKNTKDIDRPISAKDKTYILDQLKKHNDEQLTLLYSEINNWQSDFNLSTPPNPRVQRIIQFYETVLIDFRHWYKALGLDFPTKSVTDSSIDLKVEKTQGDKKLKHLFIWNLGNNELENLYNSLTKLKLISMRFFIKAF